MTDDIDDFERFMQLPETISASFAARISEAMADPAYAAEMMIQDILWSKDKP